eukprot:m.37284 g.37284  ORF g.37284 m.37284 type:complete len:605 (+) comp5510_c0_seq1:85-1899(+)
MPTGLAVLAFGAVAAHAATAPPPTLVINTTSGAVQGRCAHMQAPHDTHGCDAVYYNIPFAMPPVNERRFAPPEPAVWHAGVRDGTRPGPACFQTPHDPTTVQSEDCLTVDVWVPAPQTVHVREGPHGSTIVSTHASSNVTARLRHSAHETGPSNKTPLRPVLVFFYGGGALSGASSWYNFSRYTSDGFVVVAANYRVGPLGFLALAELSKASSTGASGNYGLMDCDMALQFAVTNAVRFGGDPQAVTVMGQSSGATMVWGLVGHHWSSGSTRPFQRAVALSGSPNITMQRAHAEQQNAPIVASLGCAGATDVLACLRAVPATAVSYGHAPINTTWQEYDALTWGLPGPEWRQGFPLPGIVIVDGAFITAPLIDLLSVAATGNPINFLVSNVAEEDDLMPNQDFSHNTTMDPLNRYANARLSPWGGPMYGQTLLQRYFDGTPPQQAYLQLASTMGVVCGSLNALHCASASTPGAKLSYMAVVDGPSKPQTLGVRPGYISRFAYHQYDLLWSMQQWDFFADFAFGPHGHPPYTPTDDDMMQSMLLRHAYMGIENSSSPVPPFHNRNGSYTVGLVRKRQIDVVPNWQAEFCAEMKRVGLWQSFWWAN